jgi:hypothetical protein
MVDQDEYPTQGCHPDVATDNTTNDRRAVTADRRRRGRRRSKGRHSEGRKQEDSR